MEFKLLLCRSDSGIYNTLITDPGIGYLSIPVESFCRQFIVHCPLRLYLRRHATDPLGSDSLLFVMRHHSHSAVLLPVFLFPCRFFQSETQNAIAAAPGIGDHLRPG